MADFVHGDEGFGNTYQKLVEVCPLLTAMQAACRALSSLPLALLSSAFGDSDSLMWS